MYPSTWLQGNKTLQCVSVCVGSFITVQTMVVHSWEKQPCNKMHGHATAIPTYGAPHTGIASCEADSETYALASAGLTPRHVSRQECLIYCPLGMSRV